MTVKEKLEGIQRSLSQLNDEVAFLMALPQDLNVAQCFKMKPYWVLTIADTPLADCLKLFAPLALEFAGSRSANHFELLPLGTPSTAGSELHGSELVYPVRQRDDATGVITWYATAANGDRIVVQLTTSEPLVCPKGYEYAHRDVTAGHVVFTRKPKELPPPALSPKDVFDAKWEALCGASSTSFNARQKQFAVFVKTVAAKGIVLSAADLPTNSTNEGPEDTYSAESKLSSLARIGRFRSAFNGEETQRLLALANDDLKDVEAEEAAFIQGVLQKAKASATKLFKEEATSAKNAIRVDLLQYFVQKTTGHDIEVGYRNTRKVGADGHIVKDFWLYYRRWNEGLTVETPSVYDPQGFDWNQPSFMEYEPV